MEDKENMRNTDTEQTAVQEEKKNTVTTTADSGISPERGQTAEAA